MISSITKSVSSILVGIALEQDTVLVDDNISGSFAKSLTDWVGEQFMPLSHVLSMTNGTSIYGNR